MINWQQLKPDVWLTVTQPDDANVLLIAGRERALLVDAGGTAEVGAELLASARRLSPVPVEQIVITHAHYDHWHGLAGMTDVESIAHESLASPDVPDELRPTTTFSLVHALDLGDCFVEIVHFGPAHTRSDVVVIVPSKDVIAVGDLLEDEPQFDEDSLPSKWPGVLDSALGSAGPDTLFVPGHGVPGSREDAMLCGGKLGFLYSTVEQLYSTGTGEAELYEAVAEWPFAESTVRSAIPFIVAELTSQGVVPRKRLPLV